MGIVDGDLLKVISDRAVQQLPPGEIHIEETDPAAPGRVSFISAVDTLRLLPWENNHPIRWFYHSRCADGAIILNVDNATHIHIVEIKSKLSSSKWIVAKQQCEGMLANALATISVLDLPPAARIYFHIAYTELALAIGGGANTVLNKPLIGIRKVGSGGELPTVLEFEAGRIRLLGRDAEIRPVQRDEQGNAVSAF